MADTKHLEMLLNAEHVATVPNPAQIEGQAIQSTFEEALADVIERRNPAHPAPIS